MSGADDAAYRARALARFERELAVRQRKRRHAENLRAVVAITVFLASGVVMVGVIWGVLLLAIGAGDAVVGH